MKDEERTEAELIAELDDLRRRLAAFQSPGTGRPRSHQGDLVPTDPAWDSFIANTPVVVVILDRDCVVRFLNHTDSGSAADQVVGKKSFLDFCDLDDKEAVRDCIAAVFETGRPRVFEAPAVRIDGESHWYQGHVGPILEGGKVVSVSVVIVNITDRKRAERALNESERRYRHLAEAIPQPVWRTDAKGEVIDFNRRWYEYTGQTPETARGNGWMEAMHPEDRARFGDVVREVFAGGDVHKTQYRLRRASDGQFRWQLVRGLRMKDEQGRILGWFGTTTDIHEQKMAQEKLEQRVAERTAKLEQANRRLQREIEDRKRAEEALRRSEENYRTLLEACPDPVLMTDMASRVVFASVQAVKRLGYASAEEVCSLIATDLVAESDRPRLVANLARLRDGGLRQGVEYQAVRKDGTEFPCEVASAVVHESDGMPSGLVAVARDITERKEAEKALRRERRTLEQLLESGDHERQMISYEIHDGLAQELAAALMQFDSYEHLLKKGHSDNVKTAYARGVEMVRRAHAEARRLINGVRPPVLDEAGLSVALAQLIHGHKASGGPKIDVCVAEDFQRLPPTLENAVYRMAQEALKNACKHSRSPEVRLALAPEDGRIVLEVQDWGIGFDPGAVPEDRFGLKGIRERTRLLGGQIKINSQPGEGTCVRVVVPLPGGKTG